MRIVANPERNTSHGLLFFFFATGGGSKAAGPLKILYFWGKRTVLLPVITLTSCTTNDETSVSEKSKGNPHGFFLSQLFFAISRTKV